MPRALSTDLRARVVEAVMDGMTCREASGQFGVAVSSAVKWTRKFRDTGSLEASPSGGVRRDALRDDGDWVLQRIRTMPDITLHALLRELKERGCQASYGALWRFLERQKLSFKKNSARQRAE
jgi:transposase